MNQRMSRRRRMRIATLIASLAVSIAFAERAARIACPDIQDGRYWSCMDPEPRMFAMLGADAKAFDSGTAPVHPDPLLGWDEAPRRCARWSGSGRPRVLFVGDSYTFGSEVDDCDTFASRLSVEFDTINLAVPGYGTDQAMLKLERDGLPLRPDVVVFGFFVGDLERSGLSYFGRPKPLRGTPRDLPSMADALADAQKMIEAPPPRLWLLARAAWRRAREQQWHDDNRAYFVNSISNLPLPVVVLNIPAGAENGVVSQSRHEREAVDAIDALDGPHVVDLRKVFEVLPADVRERLYVRRADHIVGHLSPLGHAIAAGAIEPTLRRIASQMPTNRH